MANRPLRANDVQVDTIRRAYCRIPGCKWVGEDRSTYNTANDDRQRHLTWHREGQATAGITEEADPWPTA